MGMLFLGFNFDNFWSRPSHCGLCLCVGLGLASMVSDIKCCLLPVSFSGHCHLVASCRLLKLHWHQPVSPLLRKRVVLHFQPVFKRVLCAAASSAVVERMFSPAVRLNRSGMSDSLPCGKRLSLRSTTGPSKLTPAFAVSVIYIWHTLLFFCAIVSLPCKVLGMCRFRFCPILFLLLWSWLWTWLLLLWCTEMQWFFLCPWKVVKSVLIHNGCPHLLMCFYRSLTAAVWYQPNVVVQSTCCSWASLFKNDGSLNIDMKVVFEPVNAI